MTLDRNSKLVKFSYMLHLPKYQKDYSRPEQ